MGKGKVAEREMEQKQRGQRQSYRRVKGREGMTEIEEQRTQKQSGGPRWRIQSGTETQTQTD